MGRLRHEAGQTVVLVAVMLPLFLGLGAIAVDIGYWYVVKKTAQDAADAAALAAARELPDCNAAVVKGQEYGLANMPDATVEVRPPGDCGGVPPGVVDGGPTAGVEVIVRHATGTFFGRAFGFIEPTVTARAVAARISGDDNLAIFANNPDCDGDPPLEFRGSDMYVNGFIHANGRFRISTGPFWAAGGTYNVDTCPASVEPGVLSQFGEDRPPPWGTACSGSPCRLPNEGTLMPWPMWFTPVQFGWPSCTYQATSIEITDTDVELMPQGEVIPHGGVIPSGTYCAASSFQIDGDGLRGRLTVLAPQITVEGANLELSAFSQNVLFFAIPNSDQVANDGPPNATDLECVPDVGSDLRLDGGGNRWTGIVFNPCGRIVVNLGNTAIEGAIIGDRVVVEGSMFEMIGKGDFQYSTALVE